MDENGLTDIADFSFSPEPKRFKINDDIFECSPELPLGVLARAAKMKMDKDSLEKEGLEPILRFFDEVFIGDSSKKFRSRIDSKSNPIGMRHILKIMPWLLEVYGLRPTDPSEPFSLSPTNDGMTSTDGASQKELTASNSNLQGS